MFGCRIFIGLPVLCLLGTLGCNPGAHPTPATTRITPLMEAQAVLDEIARQPANAIPDAVLNHTQCLLVFPSSADADAEGLHGIASCLRAPQEWDKPGAVTLSGGRARKGTGFLIFLLSSSAPGALQKGKLELRSVAPGPLVRVRSVVAPVELRSDAAAYARSGAQLRGISLGGTVRSQRDHQWSEQQAGQYSSALVSFFNTIVPTGIIIHHTATIPAEGKVPASEREVDQYHKTRGFNALCFGREYHVAYHYLVLPNGSVQQGRPERCEGAHAPGYNSYLGISVAGDFSSADNPNGAKGALTPTPAQLKSVIELCRKLRREYNIPVQHILRHSDVAPTLCPGDRFPFLYIVSHVARASP